MDDGQLNISYAIILWTFYTSNELMHDLRLQHGDIGLSQWNQVEFGILIVFEKTKLSLLKAKVKGLLTKQESKK